jgi:sensor domain CHASE-containing protein
MAHESGPATRQWRFSVSILLPVAVCLIVTVVAVLGFVLWSAQGVDQRALERQTSLARHVIATQLERIPHDQESVTIWDDSILHTKLNFDPDWIDVNLGIWMRDFFGHDDVLVLDQRSRPIYAMAEGIRVGLGRGEAMLDDLKPLVALLRIEVAGGGIEAYYEGRTEHPPRVSDLVNMNGSPSLVSVTPIITDSGAIEQGNGTEYLHVSIVRLDADYASRLGNEYQIPGTRFTLYPSRAPDRAVLPLANSDGRFITFLEWERSRPCSIKPSRRSPPPFS